MVRLTLKPVAECQQKGCGWTFKGFHFPAVTIRANAEHHVQDTGHPVEVVIQDITRYTPERAS